MKRLYLVIPMMVAMIAMSCFSLYKVYDIRGNVIGRVDALNASLERGDTHLLEGQIQELYEYWQEEGRDLMHYIRINQVDELSLRIARLNAFAANEEYGEFQAELSDISWHIDNIWRSELPTFGNVF